MKRKLDLIVFDDIKGLAFMDCPYCDRQICLNATDWSYCKKPRDKSHLKKLVYKLVSDMRFKGGFKKVVYAKVPNFQRKTLNELEE